MSRSIQPCTNDWHFWRSGMWTRSSSSAALSCCRYLLRLARRSMGRSWRACHDGWSAGSSSASDVAMSLDAARELVNLKALILKEVGRDLLVGLWNLRYMMKVSWDYYFMRTTFWMVVRHRHAQQRDTESSSSSSRATHDCHRQDTSSTRPHLRWPPASSPNSAATSIYTYRGSMHFYCIAILHPAI